MIEVLPPAINPDRNTIPLFVGTPTLGTVRIEWHNAMMGLVSPTNFAVTSLSPINYLVDDAQNLIVDEFFRKGCEWLLLLEDDTIPPPDLYLRFRGHVEAKTAPVISGLYYLKGSDPPEPLMYRKRGTGAFRDWHPGEVVWVDGVPTGCLFIHRSILEALAKRSETYTLRRKHGADVSLKRIFETPRRVLYDGATGYSQKVIGTSDLYFCERLMDEGIFRETPWPELQDREFPFPVDTAIRCGHIDRARGVVF